MLLTILSREAGTSNLVVTQVDAESSAVVSEKYIAPIADAALGSPGFFSDDCIWYSNNGNLAIRPSYLHREGRPIYITTPAGGDDGEVRYTGVSGFNLLQVGATVPTSVAAGTGVSIFLLGPDSYDLKSMLLPSGVLVRIRGEQEWAACFFSGDGEISTVEEGVSSVEWSSAIGFSDGSGRLVSIILDEVTGQTTVRVSSTFQPGWNPETIDLSFSAVTPVCADIYNDTLSQAYCAGLAQEVRERCAANGIGDVVSMQGLYVVYEDSAEFYLDDYWADDLVAELSEGNWRIAGRVNALGAAGWSGTEVMFSVDPGYLATEIERQNYTYEATGDLGRGILLDMRYSPPPVTPAFWTGLQNAIELTDYEAPAPALPAVGEYWTGEGGYYAGIWAHPSGDEYHMIVAPIEFDVIAANWTETYGEVPGARSNVNGPENTAALLALSKQAWAAEFCAGTTIDGHSDFYLMAGAVYGRDVDGGYEASEAKFIVDALGAGSSSTNFGSSGPQAFQNDFYWTSTELSNSGGGYSGYEAIRVRMTDGADNVAFMDADFCRVRPIRRIPV